MTIKLEWLETYAKGCVDVFKPNDFAKNVRNISRSHQVLFAQNQGKGKANHIVFIENNVAFLNYEPFNDKNIFPGIMILIFENVKRQKVKELWWKDKDASEYAKIKFRQIP